MFVDSDLSVEHVLGHTPGDLLRKADVVLDDGIAFVSGESHALADLSFLDFSLCLSQKKRA